MSVANYIKWVWFGWSFKVYYVTIVGQKDIKYVTSHTHSHAHPHTHTCTHTHTHMHTHSRFSPDGKLLAVGSDDACVDIYCTSDPSQGGLPRCGYCRGIPSAVTSLDWSHDSRHLQVSDYSSCKIQPPYM